MYAANKILVSNEVSMTHLTLYTKKLSATRVNLPILF